MQIPWSLVPRSCNQVIKRLGRDSVYIHSDIWVLKIWNPKSTSYLTIFDYQMFGFHLFQVQKMRPAVLILANLFPDAVEF